MAKIETYELTHLYKQLKRLEKRNMAASGIRIQFFELDNTDMGEMEFAGEFLPALLPALFKALDYTLSMRRAAAKSDIARIELALTGGHHD
jgi:hypothetical protein